MSIATPRPATKLTVLPAPAVKAPPAKLVAPPGLFDPSEIIARETGPAHRTYCGPWALMALTGRPYVEVIAAINRTRSRPAASPVRGMYLHEIENVLYRLGFGTTRLPPMKRHGISLARLLRERTAEQVNETWVVQAARHFVLVRGRKVTCAMLRCWTWTGEAKRRRGIVSAVTRIG